MSNIAYSRIYPHRFIIELNLFILILVYSTFNMKILVEVLELDCQRYLIEYKVESKHEVVQFAASSLIQQR